MKGLILKDIYTIFKQMKMFIVMIIIFQLLPGFSLSTFAIVYCAMLPVTALAYDERSKWNTLAAMLPFKARDIVISKYILGYIAIAITTILAVIIKSITNVDNFMQFVEGFLFAICIASLIQALNLPFMFKFGVEKGRYFFILIIAVIVITGTIFQDVFPSIDIYNLNVGMIILLIVALVIINIVSMVISIKLYKSSLK